MSLVKPTLVIGIGGAGINMVEHTEELIKKQFSDEKQQAFRYIALDTHENIGEKIDSDNIYPIPIEQPSGDIIGDAPEYHYISGNKTLSESEGGVDRTRPLARYHLDDNDNYSYVMDQIESQIDDHVAEFESTTTEEVSTTRNLNVWILNSLGGGTGSGLFLSVARLLKDVDRGGDYNLYMSGIGATPNLNINPDPSKVSLMSEDYLNYYTNAYTAIKELEQVINHPGHNKRDHFRNRDYGFSFSDPQMGQMDVDGPLFEEYYLLGQDPDETNYQRLNRIAGMTVILGARLGGEQELENFPDGDSIGRRNNQSERLYMVDASEIHVPVEPTDMKERDATLSNIAYNKELLQEKVSELEELYDNREKIEQELEYIKSVVSMKGGGSRTDDTLSRRGIIEGVNNTVTRLNHSDIEDSDFSIESLIKRCLNETPEGITNENIGVDVPDRIIIKYACTDALVGHIAKGRGNGSLLKRHDFYNEIKDICQKLIETEKIDYGSGEPFYEFEDPVIAWNAKLKSVFEKSRDKHKEEAEKQNDFFSQLPFGTDHESEYKRLRGRIREIDELRDNYERLQQIKSEARSKHQEVNQEIDKIINQLTEENKRIQTRIDEVESEKGQINIRIENGRNRLLSEQSEFRYEGLSLDQNKNNQTLIESISQNNISLNQLSTINDLISENFFTNQELANAVNGQLKRISNPKLHNKGTEPDSIIALFGHSDVINDSGDNFLDYTVPSGRTLRDELEMFDYHSSDELYIETDNGFSVWAMALFTGIDLESLYEYAHFNESFVSPDMNVKQTTAGKSGGYDDQQIAEKFAYPELLSEDEKEYVYELNGHYRQTGSEDK